MIAALFLLAFGIKAAAFPVNAWLPASYHTPPPGIAAPFIGVVEVKINHIETPDEVAWRIDLAEKRLGPDRIAWVHPDCGFWMLKRSVADRKMAALVAGRNKYLGI